MLTLGTGVGGGLILDDRLYRGAVGAAGELGHITLDLNGPPCQGACPGEATSAMASGLSADKAERAAPSAPTATSGGRRRPDALVDPRLLVELASAGPGDARDVSSTSASTSASASRIRERLQPRDRGRRRRLRRGGELLLGRAPRRGRAHASPPAT